MNRFTPRPYTTVAKPAKPVRPAAAVQVATPVANSSGPGRGGPLPLTDDVPPVLITVYLSTSCGHCHSVASWLNQQRPDYADRGVRVRWTNEREAHAALRASTGSTAVPAAVLPNGRKAIGEHAVKLEIMKILDAG